MNIGELVAGIDIGATHVRFAIYNPVNWELVGQISHNRIKHAESRLQISPDEFTVMAKAELKSLAWRQGLRFEPD